MEKIIKTFRWLLKISDDNLNDHPNNNLNDHSNEQQKHFLCNNNNEKLNYLCQYDETTKSFIITQNNQFENNKNISFKSRGSRGSRGSWDWFVDISPNNMMYTSSETYFSNL